MEIPKRLDPKKDTLRELYLKSGNRCAFPGCEKTILNDKGNVVGQICHIEAALPGGERFNPNQTNEERRQASNLLLLCYEHHIETNDVKEYTVKRLKKMKKNHEKTYGDVANKLFSSISDKTANQEYTYCETLKKYEIVLDLALDKEVRLEIVGECRVQVDKLRVLSPNTLKLFRIMLKRSEDDMINLDEIQEVTGLTDREMVKHVNILFKKGLITEPEGDEYGTAMSSFEWDLWSSIKDYAQRSSITLEEIIDNIDFSLLD
ncbi:hypothetical protein [Bacillus thuringiensis]|uniref:hypothetical protein n=1 Tax=Bacillus thuringiensis TaxID=1428 RepID=UPI000C209F4F|nr:hypothetical protein [Bacillus thuringiensis]MEB9694857.1 hypothetical protein [Bacillus cereus]